MTTNQSAAPREVVEAQGAIAAYKQSVGDKSFADERNALHDALRAMMERMGKTSMDVEVAEAMAAQYRTDDNWGLLVLVSVERIRGEAITEDLKRREAIGKWKPAKLKSRRH